MYSRIIFSQYGQSCAQPSQMRRAFPIPFAQRMAESASIVGVGRVVPPDGEDDVLPAECLEPAGVVLRAA